MSFIEYNGKYYNARRIRSTWITSKDESSGVGKRKKTKTYHGVVINIGGEWLYHWFNSVEEAKMKLHEVISMFS